MALGVRTNISALVATQNMNKSKNSLTSSVNKIASGNRVEHAEDDSAGLSVAVKMNSFAVSLQQAMRNTNDGISLVQTAEGSLSNLSDILVRLRELSVQAGNETFVQSDREMITMEGQQLTEEFQHIVEHSMFNGIPLLNSGNTNLKIQVSYQNTTDDTIGVNLASINATLGSVGLGSFLSNIASFGSMTQARSNMDDLDIAITAIGTKRATLGALQNRMENALATASNHATNLDSTQSRIVNLDYATESANMVRHQLQMQSSVAALAQAKNMPQSLLSLLQ
jgi:flagellin